MSLSSAANAGFVRCSGCELVSRMVPLPEGCTANCSRCGSRLNSRQPQSLERATALVIAAFILYIPANLYPVMYVSRLGRSEGDTILSGVQSMFAAGWWVIGALIFFASVTVPLLKLTFLSILLISVKLRRQVFPRQRTTVYKIVEYIGRWSMLDMFVVSLTVALIQLGAVAEVQPGPGATWFGGVVVLTMLAAMSFDPRLIWDELEEEA